MYADQAGAQSNIGPTRFTIPGLAPSKQSAVYATSDEAMQGGIRAIGIIGEEDSNRAQAEFEKIFKDFVTEKAKVLLPDYSGIIVEIQNKSITPDKQIGSEVDSFTLTGKARIIAVGYNERELLEWANTKLKEKVGTTRLVLTIPDSKPEVRFDALTDNEQNARLIVTRTGTLHLNTDNPLIAPSAFVGKTSKQTKDYLGQVSGIDAVSIEFFPKWLKNAPTNPNKITVNVTSNPPAN